MKKSPFTGINPINFILAGFGFLVLSSLSALIITGIWHETKFSSLLAGIAVLFCIMIFVMGYFLIKSSMRLSRYENELKSCKIALLHMGKKATTDRLTRLFNRCYLESFLDSQLEYSKLYSQPLSIIMIDIDQFKYINDTYGHLAGDHILVFFSGIIIRCTRRTDIAARYGGDEFMVILPDTGKDIATDIAERIRKCTNEAYFPPYDGNGFPTISCSIGISTYPEHCSSRSSLIKTADEALYLAKNSGRNCVKVYNKENI